MDNEATIHIDHREHCDILKLQLKEYGFNLIEQHLTIGDYIVYPDTTIERKTIHDFAISILDGRLFNQAYRLSMLCERPIIIIEGKSFINDNSISISIGAAKGALITLAQTYQIPVLRTIDEKETAWYIKQLHLQRQRVGSHKKPLSAYTPQRTDTKKEYILKAFPGIGQKMAKTLIDKFGSITNVVNATYDELSEIHGLGPKTIEQIHHVIRENEAIYQTDKEKI